MVQEGPDGNSPSCVAHLAFWGDEMRPTPFVANSSQSCTSGTANSSLHQPGVSQASAFQATHLWSSFTGGLGEGAFSSSSSEFSADPLRKQATSGPNYGSSSKSGSSIAVASPPDSEFLWEG